MPKCVIFGEFEQMTHWAHNMYFIEFEKFVFPQAIKTQNSI